MAYKTTKAIRDTQDNDFCYYAGAIYPRKGLEVSKERLETLVKNGYIVAVDDKKPEPVLEEVGGETKDRKVELTSKEIKAKLDELGIEYKSSASKADLLALLEGTGGE
ncbi:HeH/LEM domain-containing protein [Streptococcus sp.]|uniref:HeH/LEM domain-containing protein n=1 Tax=Streptococcus sp. TaxID=1306 RepID=UPI0025F6355C|nr:HeH/LEM domain-containing protein [Streptococcus sp.]